MRWMIQKYGGWSKIKVVMITASHMIHCDFNAMSTWGVRGARFSGIKRPERSWWPLLRKLLSLNPKFSFFMSKNNFTIRCPPPRLLSAYGDIVTRLLQRWTFQKNTVIHIFLFWLLFWHVEKNKVIITKTLSFPYCVTRASLLYFIRSWVALSFKVCESVSPSGIRDTCPDLHFVQYIKAFMPSTDPV